MPEVVCDTSALQYLHQLGRLDLLRKLYEQITVPQAVADEIAAGMSRDVDLPDLSQLPWVHVRPVALPALVPGELGAGELAVLSLASKNPDALAVLDDELARRHARLARIRFTGTCGVLLRAKQRGFEPAISPLIDQFIRLGFRLDVRAQQERQGRGQRIRRTHRRRTAAPRHPGSHPKRGHPHRCSASFVAIAAAVSRW